MADSQGASSGLSLGQPVTATMETIPSEVGAGDTCEILVRVKIAAAHHVYASNIVGKPFIPITISLTLPKDVEALGDWIGPEPVLRKNGEFVYTDSALFRRRLRVGVNVPPGPLSIKSEMRYQACTEELCWPPRTIQLSSSISVSSSKR
jgi:hypothetical protein